MGFWDKIGDRVKGIRNDLSTRVPDAVTKMDQVIRVDAVQKLQQHWPDDETRAQIGLFTTTFVKKTARYVVYEGFKHIPGATVVSKLVSDTMREVKQENHKVGIEKEADIVERDSGKSTSQPDNFSQNGNLSSQNAGGDGEVGILEKDSGKSTSQPDNFSQNGNFSSQNQNAGGDGEVGRIEKDSGKSTLQPDNFSQNGNFSSQNAGGDGEVGMLEKDLGKSTSQPDNFSQNGDLSSQNAGGNGTVETKDKINVLMKAKL